MSDIQESENKTIRDYELMDEFDDLLNNVKEDVFTGIHLAIHKIAQHLMKKHFQDKIEINVKALVKTFDELDEIAMEKYHHKYEKNKDTTTTDTTDITPR